MRVYGAAGDNKPFPDQVPAICDRDFFNGQRARIVLDLLIYEKNYWQ